MSKQEGGRNSREWQDGLPLPWVPINPPSLFFVGGEDHMAPRNPTTNTKQDSWLPSRVKIVINIKLIST